MVRVPHKANLCEKLQQPRKVHPAYVMDIAGDHAAQIGHRQVQAMFSQQPGRMQPAAPIAAVAGYPQHRKTGGNLAEQDDTSGKYTRALDVHHTKAPHQHDERAITISRSSKSGSSENSTGVFVTTKR
jgi:hypothetical protein